MKELVGQIRRPGGFSLYGNFELSLTYLTKETFSTFEKYIDFEDLNAANNRIAFIEATSIVREARESHVLQNSSYQGPYKTPSMVVKNDTTVVQPQNEDQKSEELLLEQACLTALFWNKPLLVALSPHLIDIKLSNQNLSDSEVSGICFLLTSEAPLKVVNLSRNPFSAIGIERILRAASNSKVQRLILKQTMTSGQAALPLLFKRSFKELQIESRYLKLKSLLSNTNPRWRANHVFSLLLYEQNAFKPDDPLHFFESGRALEELLTFKYKWHRSDEGQSQVSKKLFFSNQDKPYSTLLVMNFSNHAGQAGPLLIDLLLTQERLQYLILANQDYTDENLIVFFKAIAQSPSASTLSYIDVRGNRLGGTPYFLKLLSYFPKTLDTLVLAGNLLRNYDLRQLSCIVKINTTLDIRDNHHLTLGASKTFPIFYLKSERNVNILHTLRWEELETLRKPGLINCIKRCLYKRSVRFRFHEDVIDKIERNCPFTFCLAMLILLSYLTFLTSIFCISILLQTLSENGSCYDGHQWLAHGLFGGLLLLLALVELILLLKLRRRLPLVETINGKFQSLFPLRTYKLLWKLCSSALSRADLYTDVIFIVILFDCEGPTSLTVLRAVSTTSVVISLLFPLGLLLYTLFSATRLKCCKPTRVEFKRLERLARLSYIADFKGLGAVFGSFCVDLKLRCGNFERSVPRLYAVYRLIMEDTVQCVCQLIFMFNITDFKDSERVNAEEGSQLFLRVSITLTILNFFVSLFNIFITAGAKPSRELFMKFVGSTDHYYHFQAQLTYRLHRRNVNLEPRYTAVDGAQDLFLSPHLELPPVKPRFAEATEPTQIELVIRERDVDSPE